MTLVDSERIQRRLYDELARDYDSRYRGALGYYHERLETQPILSLLPSKISVLLDVGTGTGRIVEALSSRADQIIAGDLSIAALEIATAKKLPNAIFSCMNARQLPLRNASVDVATCIGLFEYVTDLRPILSEIARVLRTGGRFVFTCYNNDNYVWRRHERLGAGLRRFTRRTARSHIDTGRSSFSRDSVIESLAQCSLDCSSLTTLLHVPPVWFELVPPWLLSPHSILVVGLNLALKHVFSGGGAVFLVHAVRK